LEWSAKLKNILPHQYRTDFSEIPKAGGTMNLHEVLEKNTDERSIYP
jgi:hypothetical protein